MHTFASTEDQDDLAFSARTSDASASLSADLLEDRNNSVSVSTIACLVQMEHAKISV